eukprot:2038194-Pyramimonas_sp.AAC.1
MRVVDFSLVETEPFVVCAINVRVVTNGSCISSGGANEHTLARHAINALCSKARGRRYSQQYIQTPSSSDVTSRLGRVTLLDYNNRLVPIGPTTACRVSLIITTSITCPRTAGVFQSIPG